MIVSNNTSFDHTHRIFISSPKLTSDRTGLYIILLLLILLFILLFYLFYNFISFKRYTYSQKHTKMKEQRTNYSEKQFNDRLTILLTQSPEKEKIKHVHSFEELIVPSHQIPLTPLYKQQTLKQMKKSISNQYHITNRLVSDL